MLPAFPVLSRAIKVPHHYYPWLMWSLALSFAILQFWTQLAFGYMGSRIMYDYSLDALGLSRLSAAFFYTFIFMQIPSGILIDRYGAAQTLKFTVAALAVGCLLFASADKLWVAYIGRMLMGTGSAFAFVGMLSLASGWFSPKKFASIVAVSEMTCLLFVALGQFVLPLVIEQYGWRVILYTSFLLSSALLVVMWWVVRDGPHMKFTKHEALWSGLKEHLLNKASFYNALVAALTSIMLSTFIPLWGVPFLIRVHELTYIQAGWGVAFVVLGLACGSAFFGWLANQVEKRSILVAATFCELIILSIIMWAHPIKIPILYSLLFMLGAFNSVYIFCFSIAKEINPPGFKGSRWPLLICFV